MIIPAFFVTIEFRVHIAGLCEQALEPVALSKESSQLISLIANLLKVS